MIGRFLAVAHGFRKVEYSADSEPGLLRHTLVPDPPSGVLTCEVGALFEGARSRAGAGAQTIGRPAEPG